MHPKKNAFFNYVSSKRKKLSSYTSELFFSNSKDGLSKRILGLGILLLVLILLSFKLNFLEDAPPASKVSNSEYGNQGIDTFIPLGYRLIPIEILNSESLDSILGQTGVVDLFTYEGIENKKLISVAREIKILRAPHNPKVYAVLCKEQDSNTILRYQGPFVVGVSNPKSTGTKVVVKKSKSRIIYGDL